MTPDRLAALIAAWTHEAEVAEANQRADEYAGMCRDTAEALRKLERLRLRPMLETDYNGVDLMMSPK